jgi:predicted PurR-regulated permease PerM
MHLVLSILAVLCVIGGFVGFFLGVIPTIVLWVLAALFIVGAWRSRPASQRRQEQRFSGPPA